MYTKVHLCVAFGNSIHFPIWTEPIHFPCSEVTETNIKHGNFVALSNTHTRSPFPPDLPSVLYLCPIQTLYIYPKHTQLPRQTSGDQIDDKPKHLRHIHTHTYTVTNICLLLSFLQHAAPAPPPISLNVCSCHASCYTYICAMEPATCTFSQRNFGRRWQQCAHRIRQHRSSQQVVRRRRTRNWNRIDGNSRDTDWSSSTCWARAPSDWCGAARPPTLMVSFWVGWVRGR